MNCEKSSELFNNIPVTIPECNPDNYNNKIQMLLTDIGCKWCNNNLRSKASPIKIPRLIKDAQKRNTISQKKLTK